MGGSKKGERRGNARKRPAGPQRTHETPGEVMREAVRAGANNHLHHAVIERRIQVARIINGPSDNVEDITPKEAMLLGMQHNLQAINDFKAALEHAASQPVTDESIMECNMLEAEIERLYDKAGEFAFKVAGYIHPKLSAVATNANLGGDSGASVLQALLDEVDELERDRPIPIEHKPGRTG